MRIEGQIQSVVPDGGYESRNGYINTFQMVVQNQGGSWTGQIGSKSQTYPAHVGDGIIVESTESEYGLRFKKINPGYGNQGGQQQQQPPPQQQRRQAPQGQPQRDFDKENRGKCRFGFYQACIQAGMNPAVLVKDIPVRRAIETLIERSMEGDKTVLMDKGRQEAYSEAANVNPEYDENYAQPDDSIPF